MLYWYVKMRAMHVSPLTAIKWARYAIAYNRSQGRSIYHAVRIGPFIIGD